VNRGTEGVPTSAEPAYPAPQNIVTLSSIGDLAVRHDTEQSLGVSDQLQARINIGAVGTVDGFIESPTPSGFEIRNHLAATIARFGGLAPFFDSVLFSGAVSVAGSFSVSGPFYGSSISAANVATSGSISSNTTVSAAGLVMTGDSKSNVFLQSLIPSGLLATAVNNVGVGSQALTSLNSGRDNTAVGSSALSLVSSGTDNTAVGSSALQSCTTGLANTAFGTLALRNLTTVNQSSAFGYGALRYVTVAAGNTGIGFKAGWSNVGGQTSLTTGINNTLLSNSAGVNLSSRNQSIALGYRATTQNDGELAIGAASAAIRGGTTGTAYNAASHGITYTVAPPVNTTTPVGWLEARINGVNFKIPLYR
jgi:hypothetical protein